MGGPARPNRRRPRLARDERDLSDEVARAEPGHEATLAYHVGLAFEDDHELASPGAFAHHLTWAGKVELVRERGDLRELPFGAPGEERDRKSTRLNSSHSSISY